jgi:hypothetical protein
VVGWLIFILICWFAVSSLLVAKNRAFFRIMTLNIKTRVESKKIISYYGTWRVNAYKKQCSINIYLAGYQSIGRKSTFGVFFVEKLCVQNFRCQLHKIEPRKTINIAQYCELIITHIDRDIIIVSTLLCSNPPRSPLHTHIYEWVINCCISKPPPTHTAPKLNLASLP